MALEIKEGQWLWIADPNAVWIPVKPTAAYDDKFSAEDAEGNTYTVLKTDHLRVAQPSSLQAIDDMINLHELFDGAILHTLRDRYRKDKIYTRISSIIVAVNPFKNLPLYTREIMEAYHRKELDEPHVYQLAEDAFNNMITKKLTQAVVVSGESGSGKTETTKILLRYLSFLSGTGNDMEKKIVDANPIIEAFGNAQTVRNRNSSRFGKWIEINFDKQYSIIGGSVKSFLLEVARVFKQDEGERNFHIFYQLCAGMSNDSRLKLQKADAYRYLTCGNTTTIAGINDADEFKQTMESFRTLQFNQEDLDDIFAILAAVLHLGNVQFEASGDKSSLTGREELVHCAELLRIDDQKLETCLLQRVQTFSKFESAVTMFFKPDQAASARDSLARALYSKLFDFIIAHCNLSMNVKDADEKRGVIGVLDIFGFECFPINRFEQLCINYTNERLQQHFNYHVFILEQESYREEDVSVATVNFTDNQGCIDLIEKSPNGVFALLDEQLVMPDGNDQRFAERLKDANKDHPYFQAQKVRVINQFQVKHYAGTVVYDVQGFLEKNRNEVPVDLQELMNSSVVCTRKLIPVEVEETSIMGKKAKKNGSIGTMFKKNLLQLMETLNASFPHFIRCLKPNSNQKADKYDAPLMNEQLRYSGIQSVVEIRQQGYPFRIPHKQFYHRFKILSLLREEEKVMNSLDGTAHRAICEQFCRRLKRVEGGWAVGKTKVLLRAVCQENLELQRKLAIHRNIALVQGRKRMRKAKNRVSVLQVVHKALVSAIINRDIDRLREALKRAEESKLDNHSVKTGRVLLTRLLLEQNLADRLTAMVEQSQNFSPAAAAQLLADCEQASFEHPMVNKLKICIVHDKINERLKASIATQKEPALTAALNQAVEAGMDPLNEEDFPIAVKAYRLRLRLQTQAAVEAQIAAATESRNRTKMREALRAAINIDLPQSVPVYATCLVLWDKLEKSAKDVSRAVEQRDLDGLSAALFEENELGQADDEANVQAKILLNTLRTLNDDLQKALATSDYEAVRRAVEAAEKGQIKCKGLDSGKAFIARHVELTLQSAIRTSRQSPNWASILQSALDLAREAGMEGTSLFRDTFDAQRQLKVVQAVRDAYQAKDMAALSSALTNCQDEEFADVAAAREWLDKAQASRNALAATMETRNLDALITELKRAEDCGMIKTESTLVAARELVATLSRVVASLNLAVAEGSKPQLEAALEAAKDSELAWEVAAYAKAREFKQQFGSYEEQLEEAIAQRRMEELQVALAKGLELGLENKAVSIEAQTLLRTMREYDQALKAALQTDVDTFNEVVRAIDAAENMQIFCVTLDLAKGWATEHVKAQFSSTLKLGSHPTDWAQAVEPLKTVVWKMEQLGMKEGGIALEAQSLLGKLETRTRLKEICSLREEAALEKALAQAAAHNLPDDCPELERALEYKKNVAQARKKVVAAIQSRNPSQLRNAIQEAQALTNSSDALVSQGKELLDRLSEVEESIRTAMHGDLSDLARAISQATDIAMAADADVLKTAQKHLEAVTAFYSTLAAAVQSRKVDVLEAALSQAAELELMRKPLVVDALGLVTLLGKAEATLTEAIASGDMAKIDEALKSANNVGLQGRLLEQAVLRVQEEAIRQLNKAMEDLQQQSVKDTTQLINALRRVQLLEINEKELCLRAAKLLSQSKDQETALTALESALERKDEIALDTAITLAKANNVPEEHPIFLKARKNKQQLIETRANLVKAKNSYDLDVLLPAIALADELGLDKTLDIWKEVQILKPQLESIATSIRNALQEGNISKLESEMKRAEEMKMAQHTKILVEARFFRDQVAELKRSIAEATKARRLSLLEQVVERAKDLKQLNEVEVVDAVALCARIKKTDIVLREALSNSEDTSKLDAAIAMATGQDVATPALKQARLRAEEDIRMDLGSIVKAHGDGLSGALSEKDALTLVRCLQRAKDLGFEMSNPIYDRAKHLKERHELHAQLTAQLRSALESKDEEKMRTLMTQMQDQHLEDATLFQDCRNYLDQLPSNTSEDNDDVRYPLKYTRKVGYMEKRGQAFPYNWKKRYFVLESTSLKYYENSEGTSLPKGSIMVEEVVKDPRYETKARFGFSCGGNRKIHIQCMKKEDKEAWLQTLDLNIRVAKRLDRLEAIYHAVSNGEVNIYKLGIVLKMIYLPNNQENTSLMTELAKAYPDGKASFAQITQTVRKLNPEAKESQEDGFVKACEAYFQGLSTTGMSQLLLAAYALWCPPKSVVEKASEFFRNTGAPITYYTFIIGLQEKKNGNLCGILNLSTNVPNPNDVLGAQKAPVKGKK